jgi:EmrB/QacA subfamily drug resistance transporter
MAPLYSPSRRSVILAIILVSYLMIVLDISIVITGLPKILQELGFTDVGLSWVSNAYTLTFGGFLLLGARAGDILGRRRMLVIGLAIFTAASMFIGIAQSPAWLITARAVQGIGSAVLAPSTLALLQINFPEGPERTRAVSFYAATAGISASVGLVLGGILADWLSWRVGFFVNVPIGIGLIVAARRYISETELHSAGFDVFGALTSTLGMSALVFGIVHSATTGWTDPRTVESLSIGSVLLASFVFSEGRAEHPILPLRLFESAERCGAYLARMLFVGASVGFFFFMTQFMQEALAYTPAEAGLAFLPAMVANFITAMLAPRFIRRFGGGAVLAASIALSVVGMSWLALSSVATTYLGGLALPMLLIGIGQGGAMGPLTAAGIAGVAREDAGAASGLINAAHQLGGALGLGVLIAVASAGANAVGGPALVIHRVVAAMDGAAAMLTIALLAVFALIVRPLGVRRAVVQR